MKKKSKGLLVAALPIANAIIWGAVFIGCSWKLKGTSGYEEIQNILYGGMIAHFILIGGVISNLVGKKKKEEAEGSIKKE